MSEDFETLTCRHCGTSVPTDQAVDVATPAGPISLCQHCHDLVVSLHHGREAVDHD